MLKSPKIIWVDSWRDIPYNGIDSTVAGFSDPKKRLIYAIKGKSSEADVEHEKYHVLKRHPDKPRDPRVFARQELEATFYAYEKIGKPKHLLEKLRGIYNDLVMKTYQIDTIEAKKILREELYALDPPQTWLDDYSKFFGEYKKLRAKGYLWSKKD